MMDREEAMKIISQAPEVDLVIQFGGIFLDVAQIDFRPEREAIVLSVLPEDELDALAAPDRAYYAHLIREIRQGSGLARR
jgi:hypothetical protein